MPDHDKLVELKAAAEEVERLAFSMTPETFYHTKWCREHIHAWDKLQKIVDKSSSVDDIVLLRQRLEDARVCTFGPEPPKRPGPHCKIHAPLWPLVQSVCASALRVDDEATTST
jgi:hypothetical protein